MKWAELLEKEIPQELYAEIQVQMGACASIIQGKDALISEFLMQLRRKDEEYVRALKQQSDDIDSLMTKIRKAYKDIQAEYDKELDSIDDAYLEERDKLIQDHIDEVDGMFDTRRTREVHYKESKQKREEQYQKEIDELISKGADRYNKLKIELEMNIQTLKQQLEEIRATYQLNTEKLDYNYRVLTELDVEKNAELARFKRRLTKLKDQLNHFMSRYHELSTVDAKTNAELTEDYRRLTQKYKDLQAKFRHFEVADTAKFEELWHMHEEEAKDLVDKVLKADKIISEQQLGWVWRPPDLDSLTSRHGTAGGGGGGDGGGPKLGDDAEADLDEEEQDMLKQKRRISGVKIRAMLKMLAAEAGFLVQKEVEDSIKELPDSDAELSRAETMLRALGVKSEDKVSSLLTYFFLPPGTAAGASKLNATQKQKTNTLGFMQADKKDDAQNQNADEEEFEQLWVSTDMPDEIQELRTMIKPEDVVSAVKAFMEDSADQMPLGKTRGADGGANTGAIKRKLKHMRSYWQQLSQVVSDESVSVWKQLEADATKYKEILERRSSTIQSVEALATRNAELKKLLNQYLGDRNNDFFQVPPAQTMKIKPVLAATAKNRNNRPSSPTLMSKTH